MKSRAKLQYRNSSFTHLLCSSLIVAQECCYSVDLDEQRKVKVVARASKRSSQLQKLKGLTGSFTPTLRRAVELSDEKGASTWLTVLPIQQHGFILHKGAFHDALCLRYAWPIPQAPQSCACGNKFDVTHAMICPKGGFPTIRHNEVRDLTVNLLTEVCHDVETEPKLRRC